MPHLLTRLDNTVSSIARLLGVSRATTCKHVPEFLSWIRREAARDPREAA